MRHEIADGGYTVEESLFFSEENLMAFNKAIPALFGLMLVAIALYSRDQSLQRVPASLNRADFCGLDAYPAICSQVPGLVLERRRELHAEGNAFAASIDEAFTQIRPGFESRVGKIKDHPGDRAFFSNWVKQMNQEILVRVITPQETARVLSNLQTLTQNFRATLESSGLPRPTVETLRSLFSTCPVSVTMQLTRRAGRRWATTHNNRNAVIHGSLQIDALHAADRNHGARIIVNPNNPCVVELDGTTWRECRDGTPECAFVYLHELAHFIDPCKFDPRVLTVPHGASASLRRASQSAAQTGRVLWERTSCLNETVNPHETLNRHTGQEYRPESFEARCVIDPEFPSQWDEAQADLWGSLALSRWLNQLPANEQYKAAIRAMGQFCPVDLDGPPSARTQYATFISDSYEHSILDQPLVDLPPESIAAPVSTQIELPTSWGSNHPAWKNRIEDIYLRNPELRQTLDCAETTPSCSPARGR